MRVALLLTDRVKAELAVLKTRRAEVDADIEKVFKLARLVQLHDQQCAVEHDHHEIHLCQCPTAMAWRATTDRHGHRSHFDI